MIWKGVISLILLLPVLIINNMYFASLELSTILENQTNQLNISEESPVAYVELFDQNGTLLYAKQFDPPITSEDEYEMFLSRIIL